MNRIERNKFNYFVFVIVKATLFPAIVKKYNIKCTNKKEARKIKGPAILLPNHISYFDPVIVNGFLKKRVHYVISDSNLRTKMGRFIFSLAGVIPKTKAIPDSTTVRTIHRLLSKNKIIGIFPEGRQSWDGQTHDVFFSTVKMVKLFKVPVIVPLIRGGYLSKPRWSPHNRKGRVEIEYKTILEREQIKKLTTDQIYELLKKELYNNDYDFAVANNLHFKSDKGAEYIESFLYFCPNCKALSSLKSEGNRVNCCKCESVFEWKDQGYLVNNEKVLKLTDLFDQQNETTKAFLENITEEKEIFTDKEVNIEIGEKLSTENKIFKGDVTLTKKEIVIETKMQEPSQIKIPITDMEGVQVFLSSGVEFYVGNLLYCFTFDNPRISGLKYLGFIKELEPISCELT
ncbi:MAG: 1-acyl-sn-glycerol-3-phosphate acyltransferase [Spirochaetales bacterium]|nr:1-acyl-sn-glycerol-3-phosphate acyltransferase [Spirochaetales bacterium]